MTAHLPVLPVLIPAVSAAVMVALTRQDVVLARVLSFIAAAAQLVVASLLFAAVGEGEVLVYRPPAGFDLIPRGRAADTPCRRALHAADIPLLPEFS